MRMNESKVERARSEAKEEMVRWARVSWVVCCFQVSSFWWWWSDSEDRDEQKLSGKRSTGKRSRTTAKTSKLERWHLRPKTAADSPNLDLGGQLVLVFVSSIRGRTSSKKLPKQIALEMSSTFFLLLLLLLQNDHVIETLGLTASGNEC